MAALAEYAAIAAARARDASMSADPWSPWSATDAGWNGTSTHAIDLTFDDGGGARRATLQPRADGTILLRDAHGEHVATVDAAGDRWTIAIDGEALHVSA